MTKLYLGRVMKYQVRSQGLALLTAFGILALLILGLSILTATGVFSGGEFRISGIFYTPSTAPFIHVASIVTVMYFVMGISVIREDFKFQLQHGIGRNTTFLASVLTSFSASAIVGLVCVLLNVISSHWYEFPASGYFFPGTNLFVSWLLHVLIIFTAYQCGVMLSLIYYRLSKLGKVLFSVIGIAAIVIGLPYLGIRTISLVTNESVTYVTGAILYTLSQPNFLLLIMFVAAIVFAAIDYLLLSRACARE